MISHEQKVQFKNITSVNGCVSSRCEDKSAAGENKAAKGLKKKKKNIYGTDVWFHIHIHAKGWIVTKSLEFSVFV